MKTLKNHETPLFEVIANKESNKKFFVASGGVSPEAGGEGGAFGGTNKS